MKPKLGWWVIIGLPFIVRTPIFIIGRAISSDVLLIASDVIFVALLITLIAIRVRQNTAASRVEEKADSEAERPINNNDEREARRG